MRRLALTLLVLGSMVNLAEARTLFSARVVCSNGGVPQGAIRGTILLHFVNNVATVRSRLEGLAPGATVTSGYTCALEGTAPAAQACPSPAAANGKLICSVSFPVPTSCVGGSPFVSVSSPVAECAPGFIEE